jgi:large subunit ribosomal protein L22
MKAYLKEFNQPPRKVRLVAGLVRGKTVARALLALQFADQKSAGAIAKLIRSAVANSGVAKEKAGQLVVKDIRIDIARKMTKIMPRAQGRGAPIRKITSHISIVLGEAVAPKEKKIQKRHPKVQKQTVTA